MKILFIALIIIMLIALIALVLLGLTILINTIFKDESEFRDYDENE